METQTSQSIEQVVREFLRHIHTQGEVEVTVDGERPTLNVSVTVPENGNLVIGKNGQNLLALEHVLRMVIMRHGQPAGLTLDINGYRHERAVQAITIAKEAAERVRNTRRAEALPPMTAYERRQVHTELASLQDVVTESIGEEPQRRVVIKPMAQE